MSAPRDDLRRGWCPSTLRPMETGDGLLVRLHPPSGVLAPAQLGRIATLAAEHGNGLVEISARGNMQLRGVSAATHPALVATLLAERLIDEHDGEGPQRLTLVSPLAQLAAASLPLSPHPEEARSAVSKDAPARSRASFETQALRLAPQDEGCGNDIGDFIDAATLADAVEALSRPISGLPAKTLVVVDGGGAMALDAFAADLRLVGIAPDTVMLGLPGGSWRGPVAAADAAALVATILGDFTSEVLRRPNAIRRMRELSPDALTALYGLSAMSAPKRRVPPRRAGCFAMANGRCAALLALPFGRSDATTLAALAHAAEAHGAETLRLSPWRGLAFHGLSRDAAEALLAEAQTLGLIVRDDDPRLSVQACAGKPACLRAEADAMTDAATLADALAPQLSQGLSLHVSGCIKSCAHPGAADLTLVGRDGRYRIVIAGSARDETVAELDLAAILERLRPGQELFDRLNAIGADRSAGIRDARA